MSNSISTASTSKSAAPSGGRASYAGPKIKKQKAAVPSSEKQKQGRALDLSFKTTSTLLDRLPGTFKDDSAEIEELRRLDLNGQSKLFHDAKLGPLRFAGGTLTWLNLSGVDCAHPGKMDWMFLRMMETLFVLTMMHCNMEELPQEIASVKSLKALVASHNSLTSASLSHLTPLKSLNSLILSDNQLTSFPSSTLISLTSLKKLSLANNRLTSDGLPSFAGISSTLEELRLNGNRGITSVPELVAQGNEASSALSVLELSHTEIKDFEEIKKLQKLPRLINLGLRDTPLSRIDDYRAKITEMLPNLRILDNVRFDPLYLARKAKGKDAEPEPSSSRRGGKGKLQHKQDKGWGDRTQESSDYKGKKRKVGEDNDDDGDADDAPRKRSNGRERDTRSSKVSPADDHFAEDTTAAPAGKKSRSPAEKKKKKKEQQAAEAAAKVPKAVGGSMSDPTQSKLAQTPTIPPSEGDRAVMPDPNGVPVTQVPKAVSAVVGVVEVAASTKKAKGPRKGAFAVDRKRKEDKKERVDDGKADVLALLAQEREKATSIGGWD
ncbi:outer arm dynein light chain 1 [Cystobasidium minutum MCA 4210]|uniref:outer arm dynein light chain 1 n=1 Tax=Cystobasidium minutum MCA 4210 TaxID=1397322 RepID=UPI0034CD5EC5|eukprot:jgi/Rhomi1/173516/fgenesh1_kg.6_\